MDHTYLRYECADAFGLSCSVGSSSGAPVSNGALQCWYPRQNGSTDNECFLFTAAGSRVLAFSLSRGIPIFQLAHRDPTPVGTGQALNANQLVCLDISTPTKPQQQLLATGWIDGTIRIFELPPHNPQLHNSLLENSSSHPDPLVLSGHTSSLRVLRFRPDGTHLASGGMDGSVVVWDLVAETGLFRLLGHRGPVTDLAFLAVAPRASASPQRRHDFLVTTSADGLVKVWDLPHQTCAQTIPAHRGEVTSGAIGGRRRLITGGSDGQVRVWKVEEPRRRAKERNKEQLTTEKETTTTNSSIFEHGKLQGDDDNDTPSNEDDVCHYMGSLSLPPNVAMSAEKVMALEYHPNQKYLGVLYNNAKIVHVYRIRTVAETQQKRQRRLRRRREKQAKTTAAGGGGGGQSTKQRGQKRGILDDEEEEEETGQQQLTVQDSLEQSLDVETIKASDEFEYFGTCRATHKIRAFQFLPEKGVKVVCALSTNAVEAVSLVKKKGEGAETTVVSEKIALMDMYGHPTGIRSVSLSSDDTMACTVSKNVTKLWNVHKRSCIQSVNHGPSCYGLCVSFLPGNTHVVIGTREGSLLILDVASSDVVFQEERAHDGAIWSVDVRRPTSPQETIAVMTGSADKTVKFWDIESQDDGHPMVVHARSLQMADDVVAVRYSHSTDPTKRMVFVAALDSTIKVFFDDTLKFFLSLYGHQLPALAIDASDDDMILASSGADKTIKIWGLDFGDTHRTLHGHEDSVTDLRFVRRSHNFFTTSKDRTVRYWDGDRFEQILILHGHSAEVNSLAISRTGAFVLSAGMDRQVRVWERTKDIVFLEEERERELEKMFDKVDSSRDGEGTESLLKKKGTDNDDDEEGDNEELPQTEAAVKKSVLSVSAGDRIMEALERADKEQKDTAAFKRSEGQNKQRMPNPLLFGLEPAHYVLWILRSVKSAELEQSLLVLPLTHVERLVYYLIVLLRQGRGVELCARVAVFMTKAHQRQIVATKSLSIPLRELRRLLRLRLSESRDTVGFNLAALRAIARVAAERKASFLPPDIDPSNIWEGMGLGSDVAAALEKKGR